MLRQEGMEKEAQDTSTECWLSVLTRGFTPFAPEADQEEFAAIVAESAMRDELRTAKKRDKRKAKKEKLNDKKKSKTDPSGPQSGPQPAQGSAPAAAAAPTAEKV
jgi:hypothetical protein